MPLKKNLRLYQHFFTHVAGIADFGYLSITNVTELYFFIHFSCALMHNGV